MNCSLCGGPLEVLGDLGNRRHRRCRDCGMISSTEIKRRRKKERCPHGQPLGACSACEAEGDHAFDSDREDRRRNG